MRRRQSRISRWAGLGGGVGFLQKGSGVGAASEGAGASLHSPTYPPAHTAERRSWRRSCARCARPAPTLRASCCATSTSTTRRPRTARATSTAWRSSPPTRQPRCDGAGGGARLGRGGSWGPRAWRHLSAPVPGWRESAGVPRHACALTWLPAPPRQPPNPQVKRLLKVAIVHYHPDKVRGALGQQPLECDGGG